MPDTGFKCGCAMELRLLYRNHRGEVAERIVRPQMGLWFGTSPYYEGEQWFLNGSDALTGQVRDFAVKDILEYRGFRLPERHPV